MADCDNLKEKLSAYIDNALSPAEKKEVEEHLSACGACSAEHKELLAIVGHVKNVKDVEPPAWLTRGIMERVKEKKAKPESIFRKLFFPLHLKLPAQLVAFAFVAIISIYILKTNQPYYQAARVPTQDTAPASVPPKKEVLTAPGFTPAPAPALKKTAPVPPTEKTVADKQIASETPKPETAQAPAVQVKQYDAEKKTFAPMAGKQESAGAVSSLSFKDETQTKTPLPMSKSAAVKEKSAPGPGGIKLAVKNIEDAKKDIQTIVKELNGRVLRTETIEDKTVITVYVQRGAYQKFHERLKLIGEIKGTLPELKEDNILSIELISNK